MREFLDRETSDHLGLPSILQMFQPDSELGRKYKEHLQPYLREHLQAWHADQEDMRILQTFLDKIPPLIPLSSLEPLFQKLQSGAVLTAAECLKIKQWMGQGRKLENSLLGVGLWFSWWPRIHWDSLLPILNPQEEESPFFSIEDGYDPYLKDLRLQKTSLIKVVERLRKEQTDVLRACYGCSPNRNREFIFPRDTLEMLEKARLDIRLELRGETSWDVVFRIRDQEPIPYLLEQLEEIEERIRECEKLVLVSISQRLAPWVSRFQEFEKACGQLDWLLCRTRTARELGWSLPIREESRWEAKEARHPLLRQATPVSLVLHRGVAILTGPNMGGKSVALKTLGVLQALAQYGMPVPADSYWFDFVEQIRFVGGDSQSLEDGLSTFGGEIRRLADLAAQRNSLLLLDEVGRATNPREGEALAVAIARYFNPSSHVVFFATHYPGVTEIEGIAKWRVAGFQDRRILPFHVVEEQTEALEIAEHMGLPQEILALARNWLSHRKEE